MSLHAFDDVDDALAATRAFLLPVDRGRWLRLALVSLFLGGMGLNVPTGGVDVPTGEPGAPPTAETPELTTAVLLVVAAVVAFALIVGLVYLFVGSIMEFVFVRSLQRETVSVRRYMRENLGRGARLFGFRVVLGLLAILVFGALVAVALYPVLVGTAAAISVLLVVVMVPIFLIGLVVFGLINGFTVAFVVPIMLREEVGVLAAWRRLWPTVRTNWKEYAAYTVVSWAFTLGLGIAAGIVVALVAVVLLIPAVIVGVIGFLLLMSIPPVGILVLAVTALLYLGTLTVVYGLVQAPVQSYLRYYALFVLGDTNADFDLIAERRAAVRAEAD